MMSDKEWKEFWDRVERTRIFRRPQIQPETFYSTDDEDASKDGDKQPQQKIQKRPSKRRIIVRSGPDCDTCINCKNKPRLGGLGNRKRACMNRPIIKKTVWTSYG